MVAQGLSGDVLDRVRTCAKSVREVERGKVCKSNFVDTQIPALLRQIVEDRLNGVMVNLSLESVFGRGANVSEDESQAWI